MDEGEVESKVTRSWPRDGGSLAMMPVGAKWKGKEEQVYYNILRF